MVSDKNDTSLLVDCTNWDELPSPNKKSYILPELTVDGQIALNTKIAVIPPTTSALNSEGVNKANNRFLFTVMIICPCKPRR